jgi:hypothetical protein
VDAVARFARHFGNSPELLGPAEIRAYQQHLLSRGICWSTFSISVCALRFLYRVNSTSTTARSPSTGRITAIMTGRKP